MSLRDNGINTHDASAVKTGGTQWQHQLSDFEHDLFKGHVKYPKFTHQNNKTTTCILTLKNDFEIVGSSGCEDPKKFDEELGKLYAAKDALKKLAEFTAYHRAEMAHLFRNEPGTLMTVEDVGFNEKQLEQMQRTVMGAIHSAHLGIGLNR